jgi:flagellar protein FliL
MSAEEAEVAEALPEQPRSRRFLILLVAMVLLVGAGGGGAWYFGLFGQAAGPGQAVEKEAPKQALYYTLADNLVVNFRNPGGVRYLQVGIDLMTRDPEALPALKTSAPVLRNNLILLLSDQSESDLSTREGKEAVRAKALAEVRSAMQKLYGSPAVDELYFTTFVMQ